MRKAVFHTHCSYCDGRAPMEEFVVRSISAGFSAYGISSHAPIEGMKWTVDKADMDDYLSEFRRLKQKYAADLELYVGLEADYLDGELNPATDYIRSLPLDYIIGSVHLLRTPSGEVVDTDTGIENFTRLLNTCFGGDLWFMVEEYFKASERMVRLGGFDFIGHMDKISYNASLIDEDLVFSDRDRKLFDNYSALIAESGLMVEVNTKSFLKRGVFYPHVRHFSSLHELGIPVVVNSDAHAPDLIEVGIKEALAGLKAAGYDSVRQLVCGKWEDIAIEI